MHWQLTNKGDERCRALADRHYSRQTHMSSRSFTRPGYNMVLYTKDDRGSAVYVWWRPKFETGESFTQRFDGLQAIECTIFRNETSILSSQLIVEACQAVQTWDRYVECKDGLITGVNSLATKKRRSKMAPPGMCFIHAGFKPMEHAASIADTWLQLLELPEPASPLKLQDRQMTRQESLDDTRFNLARLYPDKIRG